MKNIGSAKDLATHITGTLGPAETPEDVEACVQYCRERKDHPPWGTDWEDWLDEAVNDFLASENIIVYERGNGWPGVGDYVHDDEDGGLWRIIVLESSIHTSRRPGGPNFIYGYGVREEWDGLTEEDVFKASAALRYDTCI